jgi:cell division control protein 7
MEVDCLRLAGGKANVLPLLFVHRYLGDVVLAMPYVEASKFSEVIKTMDLVEMKHYIKNLLIALAHIHSLGIIHRHLNIKTFSATCLKNNNFKFNKLRNTFFYGLVLLI